MLFQRFVPCTQKVESPDENVITTIALYDDGDHADGVLADGIYGNTWITPLGTEARYFIDIIAVDDKDNERLYDNICEFETYVSKLIYVAISNETGIEDGTREHPFNTITEGINSAYPSDTVEVAKGTYRENINYNGKSFILRSETGADSTIIDGNQNGSVVSFFGGENSTAVLEGFTLINGNGTFTEVGDNGDVITFGGGIACAGKSYPTLVNVIITRNSAGYGGGICCSERSDPRLINVTIADNTAEYGGGIVCADDANPFVINSILWNNSPQEIYFYEEENQNAITIAHSNIQEGQDGIITNNNGTVNWLTGNICETPMFVNSEGQNYRLAENSPCIDAGTDSFTLEGEILLDLSSSEFYGNAPDMGALESLYTVGINESLLIPEQITLYPNYPNPFNPNTTINFQIPEPSMVRLTIYDIIGRKVETLVDGVMMLGEYSVTWDARELASGVYFCRLEHRGTVRTQKMMLVR